MNNLATALFETGDRESAIPLLRKCLTIRREVLGDKHPVSGATAESLAPREAKRKMGHNLTDIFSGLASC